MPVADAARSRLCLVTPPGLDPVAFPKRLADALAGGDVASLIVTAADEGTLRKLAETAVAAAQPAGVAVLVHNDTQVAGRARADGVHVDSGPADLATAIGSFRPKRIVGAGGLRTRHEAMAAGEANPDYVFFGRLDGDGGDAIFDKALDLAAWWSPLFLVPAMVMGGGSVASVAAAAEAGVEFVALGRAVFAAADPAAAVDEANRLLAVTSEAAA